MIFSRTKTGHKRAVFTCQKSRKTAQHQVLQKQQGVQCQSSSILYNQSSPRRESKSSCDFFPSNCSSFAKNYVEKLKKQRKRLNKRYSQVNPRVQLQKIITKDYSPQKDKKDHQSPQLKLKNSSTQLVPFVLGKTYSGVFYKQDKNHLPNIQKSERPVSPRKKSKLVLQIYKDLYNPYNFNNLQPWKVHSKNFAYLINDYSPLE